MGAFQSCLKTPPTSMVVTTNDIANPIASNDFKSCYEVMDEILGEGAYSVVRPAICRRTNERFAVKIMNRAALSKEDEADLQSEVSILRKMKHPHIVKLVDFFEEPSTYLIVMEYIEGGELFDRIVKKAFYNEKEARDIVLIILGAIKYLHDQDIVHRDLKPENLLLKSSIDDSDVKLADFGFATYVSGSNLDQQCGTPGYVAPEIIAQKMYGKPVDMWSLGVIIYILLGGYPPFHSENQKELFKLILAGKYEFHTEYWNTVSADAIDLISRMLTVDAAKRISVNDALKHPWINTQDAELKSRNLDSNQATLRRYLAKRRFKKAILAHVAVGRFKKGLSQLVARRGSADNNDDFELSPEVVLPVVEEY